MSWFCVCALFCAGYALNAQTISRVVNAASYEGRLAPGTLAVVQGTNLGVSTSTSVLVGGKAAAVVLASATQFTVQIPFDAPTGATTIQVGASQAFNITLNQYAPALFTENSDGMGNVSAFHANGSPVTTNYPATPGETISVLATGLGPTVPALATGVPGPSNPPVATAATPSVPVAAGTATVLSSVMAPGQVGIYQITMRLPVEPFTGIRNIVLTVGGFSSTAGLTTIPIAAAFAKPVISRVISATGNADSVQENIQSGSWVAIYGADFSPFTMDWTNQIKGGRLPSVLAGVSVTIGGKAAAVYYISPQQINVQAPEAAVGTVQVVVTNNDKFSESATAQVRTHAPAFFQWGSSRYAAATRYPENTYIGGPSLGNPWVGAKPGDVLILWATGFGPTEPAVAPGIVTPGAANTVTKPNVTVGGVDAPVLGAALSPGLVGVYQVAIQVPAGVPAGDALVGSSIAGFSTPGNVYVYVSP